MNKLHNGNRMVSTVTHPPAGPVALFHVGEPARSMQASGAVALDPAASFQSDRAESPQEWVIRRLEEAGRTLLALSCRGYTTAGRTGGLNYVQDAMEAYGWTSETVRLAAPEAAAITAMDEAYAWLSLIPSARYVLRRIVGARSLVHPVTDKHLYPWRKIATTIGADYRGVQRWHGQGVDIIANRVR